MLDPNPKPTEEEKIIYALSGFCIPPNVKKAIKQSLDYISAQRQAWEKEKAGLEERVKIIEQDRDSWRRCAERLETEKTEPKLTINIEESAIKELFKNQAEELTRLNAENERLRMAFKIVEDSNGI